MQKIPEEFYYFPNPTSCPACYYCNIKEHVCGEVGVIFQISFVLLDILCLLGSLGLILGECFSFHFSGGANATLCTQGSQRRSPAYRH